MADTVAAITAAPAQTGLREDVLTLPDALAQSITVLAPALSGGFISYLAAVKAGGATPLSFAMATIVCLLIGGVVSGFARTIRSAGSIYTYTIHGLGPFCGFLMGWAYTIAMALAGPALLAGSSVFASLLMAELGAPAVLTHWWLWFGAGLLGWFALAYPGVELSTRSSLVFTAAGMAVLLGLALAVIWQGGAHGNTLAAFSPHAAGIKWPGVFAGVAFGLLSFAGFETASNLAEETRDAHRNIPRAVLGAVMIGGTFFVVVTYATSIGYGVREAATAWPGSASGLAPLADTYASGLKDLVLAAVAVDAFFCGVALSNVVTRTMFTMSRDGVLPPAFGRTHPKYRTPHVALLTYLVAAPLGAVLLIAITTPATRDALAGGGGPNAAGLYLFTEGLTLLAPVAAFAYGLVSLAGIAYGLRRRQTGLVAVSVGALAGAGVAAFGSLYYSFVSATPGAAIPTPYRVIPWALLAWLLVGGLVGWRHRPVPAPTK